jgi:hypothetical protein
MRLRCPSSSLVMLKWVSRHFCRESLALIVFALSVVRSVMYLMLSGYQPLDTRHSRPFLEQALTSTAGHGPALPIQRPHVQ